LADGAGGEQERKKILQDLCIDKVAFRMIMEQTNKSGITLREIKDVTDLRYNQIKAVIAVLMHNFKI